MTGIPFEQSLKIRQISTDIYESIEPSWTWPDGPVVPGGVLLAFAAAAGYETLADDWSIDTLQSHFLLGPDAKVPVQLHVKRLSDGGRFATRAVEVQQRGKIVCFVTCSFARTKSLHGPTMQHVVKRATDFKIDSITLDDLAPRKEEEEEEEGFRWMQFQRLGVQQTSGQKSSNPPHPSSLTYTSAGIIPHISSNNPKLHALGLLALSDGHVLDGPLYLHGLATGQHSIGDSTRTPTKSSIEQFTSLSHTVHFHLHEGFRADELCYVEVTSPWTGARRGNILSRIFTAEGRIIASCVQGAYYVVKEGEGKSRL